MGPGLTETFETPGILSEMGLQYVLDWCADDQPFALNVPGMISVPYSVELNDIMLFVTHRASGEEFYQQRWWTSSMSSIETARAQDGSWRWRCIRS